MPSWLWANNTSGADDSNNNNAGARDVASEAGVGVGIGGGGSIFNGSEVGVDAGVVGGGGTTSGIPAATNTFASATPTPTSLPPSKSSATATMDEPSYLLHVFGTPPPHTLSSSHHRIIYATSTHPLIYEYDSSN